MAVLCLPALASAALFGAIMILDLTNRDYERITPHFLFGIFATLLVLFICQRGSDMLAWTLLAFPFVLLLIGWIIGGIRSAIKPSSQSTPSADYSCCNEYSDYKPCPRPCPCPQPQPRPCPVPKPVPMPTPTPSPNGCIKKA